VTMVDAAQSVRRPTTARNHPATMSADLNVFTMTSACPSVRKQSPLDNGSFPE